MDTSDGLLAWMTKIDNRLGNMETQMAVIIARTDALRQNPSVAPISMPSARTEYPVPSPITSMEEFEKFEERLLDANYWQQAVAFLRTREAWRAHDLVRDFMQSLFDSRLLAKFNLTGGYQRRNFRLTRAYALLADVYGTWAEGRPTVPNQDEFRPGGGFVDQIFILRRILQHRHQNQQVATACFIVNTLAFGSIGREALWQILLAYGLPPKLLYLINAYYSTTSPRVRALGEELNSFPLTFGVRQSCPQFSSTS